MREKYNKDRPLFNIRTYSSILIVILAIIGVYILAGAKLINKEADETHLGGTEKKIGFIKKVYEKENKKYIDYDEVKFYRGEEALEMAKSRGDATLLDGKYVVLNGYYILNESKEIVSYEILEDASINLMALLSNPYINTIENKPTTYEELKEIVNIRYNDGISHRATLCYIYLEDNRITKIESQYTP